MLNEAPAPAATIQQLPSNGYRPAGTLKAGMERTHIFDEGFYKGLDKGVPNDCRLSREGRRCGRAGRSGWDEGAAVVAAPGVVEG